MKSSGLCPVPFSSVCWLSVSLLLSLPPSSSGTTQRRGSLQYLRIGVHIGKGRIFLSLAFSFVKYCIYVLFQRKAPTYFILQSGIADWQRSQAWFWTTGGKRCQLQPLAFLPTILNHHHSSLIFNRLVTSITDFLWSLPTFAPHFYRVPFWTTRIW